jgi:hypothetical protein
VDGVGRSILGVGVVLVRRHRLIDQLRQMRATFHRGIEHKMQFGRVMDANAATEFTPQKA